jgi:hypothetical protein
MVSSDIDRQLRQAGLRVTAPRQTVLQWLAGHPHATAEQVRCGVVQQLGSVSTQVVLWATAPHCTNNREMINDKTGTHHYRKVR